MAIESRPILASARALAVENGVAEAIDFVRGDLFDPAVARQVGEVDLIVSEFIGDEIFDEEILVKTLRMRDLYVGDFREVSMDAPWLARTHWPQIIYLRDGERHVTAGDTVELAVAYVGGRGFCLDLR